MSKTCFSCEHLINRDPMTAEALDERGYEFRCNLKFTTMTPLKIWDDEFYRLKVAAIEAAENCLSYEVSQL